jgi:Ser/Thr protein kinase RdoA (MazF antagonist)
VSATDADALAAARAFRLTGPPTRASPLGSGHIHDTFAVCCDDRDRPEIVLQRINPRVFADPRLVVENAARIAAHLRRRLSPGTPDATRRCLQPIESRAGGPAHEDARGMWRSFAFVPDTTSLDAIDTPARAREAARAFGAFAAALADFPGELRDPIPGFHDFEARVQAFEAAVANDPHGRAAAADSEVEALREGVRRLLAALPLRRRERLPVRLVHNDCKINNVLFDRESGEALCVIDLDTVMRGSVLADFGDLVRTAVCRAPEDARDPELARPEPSLYEALARGYLEGAGDLLTPEEIAALPLAGPLITLETGLRFAADHLAGDVYFRVSRPDHNLDRARTQTHLALRLLDALEEARALVTRAAEGAGAR